MSPVRKLHQEPTLEGTSGVSWPASTRAPGWIVTPSTMPIVTAISAVIPNHSRV